jgi:SAM-dependent methyltransferase
MSETVLWQSPSGVLVRFPADISRQMEEDGEWLSRLIEERVGAMLTHDDSETAKHRHLVEQYCQGNGVDLGSSGAPVVPHAIQLDLPPELYHEYNRSRPEAAIQWRGNALDLPFKDATLDFVHASHLIEDFADWTVPLREWDRVLRPGGYLIIAVPDHQRFRARVAAGQGDNLSHRHESYVGELTERCGHAYEVLHDGFVSDDPTEYSILFVGRKR